MKNCLNSFRTKPKLKFKFRKTHSSKKGKEIIKFYEFMEFIELIQLQSHKT